MRVFGRVVLGAAAALCMVGATSARAAAIIDITFTGVVHTGADNAGLIGPAGADLAGMPFQFNFRFQYPHSGATEMYFTEGDASSIGARYFGQGAGSPGTASFTIGGVTFEVPYGDITGGSRSSDLWRLHSDIFDEIDVRVASYDPIQNLHVGAGVLINDYRGPGFQTSYDLLEPASFIAGNDVPTSSAGYYFLITAPSPASPFFYVEGDSANHPVSMTLSVTTVPEPATWALLVGGFAIAGAALRGGRSSRATC